MMNPPYLRHLRHLTQTIGKRGSGTTGEKAAHEYVRKELAKLGCDSRIEAFQGLHSTYLPFILGLGLLVAAEAIFCFGGSAVFSLTAFIILLIVFICHGLELSQGGNLLRMAVRKISSQNVIGIMPTAEPTTRKVALVAHVDSHRTPWIWHSQATFRAYRVLSSLAPFATLALGFVFALGIFSDSRQLRLISIVPLLPLSAALLMVVEAHYSPFTIGANDNASGVAAMLAIAEKAKENPLRNLELWWVATGCEEVGADGSKDFVKRHASEFENGLAIVLDSVAGKETQLTILTEETLLVRRKYPESILTLARHVARADQSIPVKFMPLIGGYSDAVHFLKRGLSALTFLNCTSSGWIPRWHHPTDLIEHLDLAALERCQTIVWNLLLELDSQSSAETKALTKGVFPHRD